MDPDNAKHYTIDHNCQKKAAVINDFSSFGRCSLAAALPILSALKVQCCPVPTAVFTNHTGFKNFSWYDCTDKLESYISDWQATSLGFSAIASGYLSSVKQIDFVERFISTFKNPDTVILVDPVMGDGGKLYAGFTPDYVEKMRGLCREADYILPNVTEACYLADMPYPLTRENATEALAKLSQLCKQPIATGITDGNRIFVYYVDESGNTCTYEHENIEGFFHGAGDVFAAAFVGALARGKSEKQAIKLASDYVTASIRRTEIEVEDRRYGLSFEAETYTFLQALNEETIG
jgi:pyridoxine kinase